MTDAAGQKSHKQILKSTGILGSVQVITIIIRVVRNKIIAVLLGPMGVGIAGLYQSIIDLVRSGTGFGLNFSAVRDIAEATGGNDPRKISQTILILRRWVWFTGLLGVVLTLVFCKPLSRYAFGNEKYAGGVAILSLALLMEELSGGQLALLQGLRQIGSMARANVLGVVAGFCITVPLYWMMGINGIVPAILFSAMASMFLSWFYSRRVHVESVQLSVQETFRGGLGMVRLGFFMVITGFVTTAAMYVVRGFVSNKSGIEGVGQFQAAWNLSSIYLAAVLQAMGADYFPRLSAINNDNTKVVQLVNEQTEVALLLAGPLIVGMILFLNMVVYILYSAKFTLAIGILHWQLAGTILKVISWPIAFVILAKKRGGIFIFTELSWNVIYLCLVYLGWQTFGLEITGIAFLISFLGYLVILYAIAYKICGFRWSNISLKYIVVFGFATLSAFICSRYISGVTGYCAGCVLLIAVALYSFFELRKIVDVKAVFAKLLKR
jgi:enterobacterial common antigen flippase